MRTFLLYAYSAVASIFFFITYSAVHYSKLDDEESKDRRFLETYVIIIYLIAALSLGSLIFKYWMPAPVD